MTNIEEQQLELDALTSIYPDEFEFVNENPPFSFKIFLKSQPVDCHPDDDPEAFATSLTLLASLSDDYPQVAPEVEFKDVENMDEFELNQVNECIEKQIEENLGSPMIFAVCSEVHMSLTNISENKLKAKEAEIERKKKEEEEIEMKRLIGTPVTVQSFLAWKATFDAEIEARKKEIGTEPLGNEKIKPTGKQLFLNDSKMDNSDIALLDSGLEAIEINEALFQDDENLDIEFSDED